ncbi:MAG TPA: hypothetical protein V6C96_04540 [Vampirovibrionales bacterium]
MSHEKTFILVINQSLLSAGPIHKPSFIHGACLQGYASQVLHAMDPQTKDLDYIASQLSEKELNQITQEAKKVCNEKNGTNF